MPCFNNEISLLIFPFLAQNGDKNVRKFLKEHDDFCYGTIRLAEFPDADGANFYQFLPHKDGVQGFFVAVLKRAE